MSPASIPSHTLLRSALVAAAFAVAACDAAPEPPRAPADPVLAGLLEDAGDPARELACPGASEAERVAAYHPKVLRGEVLRAATGDVETPLAGASVAVRRLDEAYEPTGEIIIETAADDQGRYCLRIPDDVPFGATLAVVATAGDLRLRRLALDPDSGRISPRSEAIVTVLTGAGIPPQSASYEALINLHTVAATAVDLMAPDDAQSEADAIAADPRVQALVARMRQ